jgi:hypothetical protein
VRCSRPATLDADQRDAVLAGLADGTSVSRFRPIWRTARRPSGRRRERIISAASGRQAVERTSGKGTRYMQGRLAA